MKLTFILLFASLGLCTYFLTADSTTSPKSISRALASSDEDAVGKITKTSGEVILEQTESSLQVGQEVYESDIIVTHENSFAKLTMKDKSIIHIGPDSIVKINTYNLISKKHREVVIDLIRGNLRTTFSDNLEEGFLSVHSGGLDFRSECSEFITINNGSFVKAILVSGSIEVIRPDNSSVFVHHKEKIVFTNKDPDGAIFSVGQEEMRAKLDFWKVSNRPAPTLVAKEKPTEPPVEHTLTEISPISDEISDEEIDPRTAANKEEAKERVKLISEAKTYHDNIELINNPEAFDQLPLAEQDSIIKKTLTTSSVKVDELVDNEQAVVLITPDNKVVFFEDHPELLAQLPRDLDGNVLGIKVNESMNPISTIPVKSTNPEMVGKVVGKTIPVVNHLGQVVEVPLMDEANESAVTMPSTTFGQAAGVNIDLVKTFHEQKTKAIEERADEPAVASSEDS